MIKTILPVLSLIASFSISAQADIKSKTFVSNSRYDQTQESYLQKYEKFLTQNQNIKIIALTPITASNSAMIFSGRSSNASDVVSSVFTAGLILTYDDGVKEKK